MSTNGISQTPFGLNYQAIARDLTSGNSLSEQSILVEFNIRKGAANGTNVYVETHNTQTDDFGLFNLVIGQGAAITGDFSSINWADDKYFLATLIDDGNGLEEIGSMQFLSVPYALHANTVSNADDADADPTNETNLSMTFDDISDQLEIVDMGGNLSVDLSSLNDSDGDPSNELITYSGLSGTELTITENGVDHTVDLAPLLPPVLWSENTVGDLSPTIANKIGLGANNPNPKSTLDVNGSVSFRTDFINTNSFFVQDEHHFLLVNNTGVVNITLPSAVANEGREYVFVFKNVTNSPIGFSTLGTSNNINGNPTFSVSAADTQQVYSVVSFGTEGWYFVHGL